MRLRTTTLTLLLLALTPAAAAASTKQLALFQDDGPIVNGTPAQRSATLAELQALGVDAVKIQLNWAEVAPRTARKPSGFDGRDPADYPGWAKFDAAVSAAQESGFRVMIALSPPVPGWATKRRGDKEGVYKPSRVEYGRFAEAAGERYPSVDLWTLWNEPSHPRFLLPQSTRRGVPYAPHAYRALVRSGVAGLRRAGHSGDRILFGELLPIGKDRYTPKSAIKPLRFMREMFCVDSRWRAYRGRAARLRGCDRFRKITGVNGFAYHPYTRAGGPRVPEPSSDDATIRSIGRITRTLDRARRRGRVGGGKLAVWNTEFDFQSNPPDPFGAKLKRIPGFMSESEWISWRNPRIASYSQYLMGDAPINSPGDVGLWQGGLRFADGTPKPGVYAAYRLPLFVRLLGPRAVEVFGAARPGGAGASVQIRSRVGSGPYSENRSVNVKNVRGYYRVRIRVSRAARRTFRASSGGHVSHPAKAVVR
ncbi:MAG TPA: hypothetical protein VFQ12_02005 [Thermoleophilaceae bacterium]|nr:hypothetical protein [Thermoleophilaceae bacterium]